MSYEVQSEQFSGPLHLLLQLIDEKELEITEVALAEVTDQYLAYVNTNEVPAEDLADFLTVAATLLYSKSKAIMSQIEVEEEVDSARLADQLRLYKAFVDVSNEIATRFSSAHFSFHPKKSKKQVQNDPIFSLPNNVNEASLLQGFKSLLKRMQPFLALKTASMERVASVRQRIDELKSAIVRRVKISFSEITSGIKKRGDVVVHFLALLELMKQNILVADQKQAFEDIVLTRHPSYAKSSN